MLLRAPIRRAIRYRPSDLSAGHATLPLRRSGPPGLTRPPLALWSHTRPRSWPSRRPSLPLSLRLSLPLPLRCASRRLYHLHHRVQALHHLRLQFLQVCVIHLLHLRHGAFQAVHTCHQCVDLLKFIESSLKRRYLCRQGLHLFRRCTVTARRSGLTYGRAWTAAGRRLQRRCRTREESVYVSL